jgi:hypothetical protein
MLKNVRGSADLRRSAPAVMDLPLNL